MMIQALAQNLRYNSITTMNVYIHSMCRERWGLLDDTTKGEEEHGRKDGHISLMMSNFVANTGGDLFY